MNVTVVDASAIAALIFDEAEGPKIGGMLSGRSTKAPVLLPLEIANVCLMKQRRRQLTATQARAAFDLFRELPIEFIDVSGHAAFALGQETGLTAYDASYLWLAEHLGGDLLTLDQALHAAWRARAGAKPA